MHTKGPKKPSGAWSDMPWVSLGLALLVAGAWFAWGGDARIVHADGGEARPGAQRFLSAVSARQLREALGGLTPPEAISVAPAPERDPGPERPSATAPAPDSAQPSPQGE